MGAGESIGTENPAFLRVMVHTMAAGQGAGTAAAAAVRHSRSPRETAPGAIQAELGRQGVEVWSGRGPRVGKQSGPVLVACAGHGSD